MGRLRTLQEKLKDGIRTLKNKTKEKGEGGKNDRGSRD